jgi:methyltransferase (TIGR00027 family)
MRRAAHQLLDDPKVLDDPVALRIIGKENAEALRADPARFESSRLSPYLRAFMAARSRYAEDELALAVGRGVSQYVILGAGLDTFAYRNPYPAGTLRVFEVDHPATQGWKMGCLEEAGIPVPGDLEFVPLDFASSTLGQGLERAGFDHGRCAFFSWLGVTEYLTVEGVMETLRFIASAPAGSGVLFDYMLEPSLLAPSQRYIFDIIAGHVASSGEPWQAFFDPAPLTAELRAMGFGHVDDHGQEQINERYFRDRKDGLRVGGLSRITIARV